jgi:hypothetical protein
MEIKKEERVAYDAGDDSMRGLRVHARVLGAVDDEAEWRMCTSDCVVLGAVSPPMDRRGRSWGFTLARWGTAAGTYEVNVGVPVGESDMAISSRFY